MSPDSKELWIKDIGCVVLKRSARAHNISLGIHSSTRVRVAVPRGVSFHAAEQFVLGKREWIRKHLELMKVRERRTAPVEPPASGAEIRHRIAVRVETLAQRHGFRFGRLSIRRQKTRWGSCSVKGNLSINAGILALPEVLQDYILLHELVHTEIRNHGPRFWERLEEICPRAREHQRALRAYTLAVLQPGFGSVY